MAAKEQEYGLASRQARYLLCCAVVEEARHVENVLLDVLEVPLQLGRREWRRLRGKLGHTLVELLVVGIGMVNAASALTAFAAETVTTGVTINGVLCFGCAGAHTEALKVGDLVVASSLTPTGAFKLLPDGSRRWRGFKGYVGEDPPLHLATDSTLRAALQQSAEEDLGRVTIVGCIGSADSFTQSPEVIHMMHDSLGTYCEDQESAALAQVCASLQWPFGCVRDISNNELVRTSVRPPGASSSLDLSTIGARSAAAAVRAVVALHAQLQCK